MSLRGCSWTDRFSALNKPFSNPAESFRGNTEIGCDIILGDTLNDLRFSFTRLR